MFPGTTSRHSCAGQRNSTKFGGFGQLPTDFGEFCPNLGPILANTDQCWPTPCSEFGHFSGRDSANSVLDEFSDNSGQTSPMSIRIWPNSARFAGPCPTFVEACVQRPVRRRPIWQMCLSGISLTVCFLQFWSSRRKVSSQQGGAASSNRRHSSQTLVELSPKSVEPCPNTVGATPTVVQPFLSLAVETSPSWVEPSSKLADLSACSHVDSSPTLAKPIPKSPDRARP